LVDGVPRGSYPLCVAGGELGRVEGAVGGRGD
jgi:hypothetical protein